MNSPAIAKLRTAVPAALTALIRSHVQGHAPCVCSWGELGTVLSWTEELKHISSLALSLLHLDRLFMVTRVWTLREKSFLHLFF